MVVIQFSGMSGSGKSTHALNVKTMLLKNGIEVDVIDGNVYRGKLCKGFGFSKEVGLTGCYRLVCN